MKKKSIAARLGVAALALTMATTSLSSGTLAKYVASKQAGGQLTIAQWKAAAVVYDEGRVESTGATDATQQDGKTMWSVYDMDQTEDVMFRDLYESAGYSANSKDGVTKGKIAPGMEGKFTVGVDPTGGTGVASDVDMDYEIWIMPVLQDKVPGDTSKGQATLFPQNFFMWDIASAATSADAITKIKNADTSLKSVNLQEVPATDKTVEGSVTESTNWGYKLTDGTVKAGATTKKEVQLGWCWPYGEDNFQMDVPEDQEDMSDAKNYGGRQPKFRIYVMMRQAQPKAAGAGDAGGGA